LAREPGNKRDLLAWLDDHRRRNPLPPPTGVKADKAFFDEMWGEDP
jgi:antitoxin VapB